MPTVREWLASIGMSEYAELFSTNRIDFAVLADLTDHDLEKLGVVLGDRRKILRAIRELGEVSETAQARVGVGLRLHYAAERRQLSVVFVDLVSSTELSAKLDPEDMGQVIGAFQKACATAVAEFGGSIAKYMGMVRSPISATPKHMKTTRSAPFARGLRWSMRSLRWNCRWRSGCRSGSASPPA